MSLRRQLIALFAALAVLPLLLVGLLDYIRSIHALEDVIASNTAVIAEQAAAELQDRFSGPAANLALLAENTAAVAILDGVMRARRAPDSTSLAYLRRLREVTRKQFAWIVYRDSASSPVVSFDDEAASRGYGADLYIASLPVRDARGSALRHPVPAQGPIRALPAGEHEAETTALAADHDCSPPRSGTGAVCSHWSHRSYSSWPRSACNSVVSACSCSGSRSWRCTSRGRSGSPRPGATDSRYIRAALLGSRP